MSRILVVDDDRINRMVLSRFLTDSQHEVIQAESGEEALDRFQESDFDVVFMDVVMPGMDGFEATRRIKRACTGRHVPVLLLTALNDEESLVRGISAGADDFISKPVSRVVLNTRLAASIRTQKLFSRLERQHEELVELYGRNEREQKLAERLMSNVLRSTALNDDRIRYVTRPMSLFNGDLLLAARTPSGSLRVCLGDFAGHGLQAAIGAMPVALMFEQLSAAGAPARELIALANERLRALLPTELFLAMCLVELHDDCCRLDLWNCGMPDVHVRNGMLGRVERFGSEYPPLGICPWDGAGGPTTVDVGAGTQVVLCSDGFFEALSERGEVFGEERIAEMLVETGDDFFDRAMAAREKFIGAGFERDDMTLVQLVNQGRAAPRIRKPCSGGDEVSIHRILEPADLRVVDPAVWVHELLTPLGLSDRGSQELGLVVAELLVNAIDHGVLRLGSGLKTDWEGFERYYELRRSRLQELEAGFVEISVRMRRISDVPHVKVRMRDSGNGFDPSVVHREGFAGRGVRLVRSLCRSAEYAESGRSVDVLYVDPWGEAPPVPAQVRSPAPVLG